MITKNFRVTKAPDNHSQLDVGRMYTDSLYFLHSRGLRIEIKVEDIQHIIVSVTGETEEQADAFIQGRYKNRLFDEYPIRYVEI